MWHESLAFSQMVPLYLRSTLINIRVPRKPLELYRGQSAHQAIGWKIPVLLTRQRCLAQTTTLCRAAGRLPFEISLDTMGQLRDVS